MRALNAEGGAGTPVTYEWTITARPDTELTATPENPTNDTTANFTFRSDQPGVTFECAFDEAVDDEVFSPCSSPQTYENLIFGEHDFAVRAKNADGHVDLTPAEFTWRVGGDTPPVTVELEARRQDRQQERHLRVLGRRPQPPVRVRARHRQLHAVQLAEDLQLACDGPAHLPGRGSTTRRP